MCVISSSSEADVVWSGIQEQRVFVGNLPLDFDINDDGVFDFLFSGNRGGIEFYFDPLVRNAGLSILGYEYDPITAGGSIGANMKSPYSWRSDERLLLEYLAEDSGSLVGVGSFYDTNAFLGVSFQVADETHYGWFHLVHDNEAEAPFDLSLTIQDWAWETEADTAIIAGAIPEPSSGILTLIGTLSLLQLTRSRRRRKQGCTPQPRCRVPKVPTAPEKW